MSGRRKSANARHFRTKYALSKYIFIGRIVRPRALRALGLAFFGHSRALRALEWPYPMSLGPSGNTAAGACQRPDNISCDLLLFYHHDGTSVLTFPGMARAVLITYTAI